MRGEEFLVVGVVAGIVLLIAGLIWLVWWTNKRRREAWMAAALELDFQYLREDPSLLQAFGFFKLFNQGRARRARNVLHGRQRDCELHLADYQYTTGHGKQQQTHVQTIGILRCPALKLPHSFLRKQSRFFDFLGKVFGGQDIDYPEDPEFSKSFVLQGQDGEATRALFDPRLREHMLRYRGTGIQFEMLGDSMLLHRGRTLKPTEARSLVDEVMEIRLLFR